MEDKLPQVSVIYNNQHIETKHFENHCYVIDEGSNGFVCKTDNEFPLGLCPAWIKYFDPHIRIYCPFDVFIDGKLRQTPNIFSEHLSLKMIEIRHGEYQFVLNFEC